MSKNDAFTRDLLPQRRGRRLALFNDKALISLSKVFVLMRDRQLADTLRDMEIVTKARTTRWLTALELLEKRGLVNGLDPEDLAAELSISTDAARDAMNRAEFIIYDVFGLHVSFPQRSQRWRLLNHKEAALKYARSAKDLSTRNKRIRLYLSVSRYNGTEQAELQIPIFRFDFTQQEALPYEAQN